MDDKEIIKLYFERSEEAIEKTAGKYGAYCYSIANRILRDKQDSEECVNDAYLRLWNAIPPNQPENLPAYLGKIARNLALNRYEKNRAKKRGAGEMELVLEEAGSLAFSEEISEDISDRIVFTDTLNSFLKSLSKENRVIFVKRYWYVYSVKEIAEGCGISESKVKISLYRSRKALKKKLNEEGLYHER